MKFSLAYLRTLSILLSLLFNVMPLGVGKTKIKKLFQYGIVPVLTSSKPTLPLKPQLPIVQANFLSSTSSLKRTWDNFHCVEEGKFYRSGQLSAQQLASYVQQYGIKTVINLRGPNPTQEWWQQEKEIAQKLSIQHHDIAMHSMFLPSKSNLITLLEIYNNAPKPILVHCLSGADRTGEASALWVLEQQGKSKKEAKKQLSMQYGYFKRRKPAKRFLISIWRGYQWALEHYDPAHYPNYCPSEAS